MEAEPTTTMKFAILDDDHGYVNANGYCVVDIVFEKTWSLSVSSPDAGRPLDRPAGGAPPFRPRRAQRAQRASTVGPLVADKGADEVIR